MSCFATISPGKSSPSLADPLGTSGSCSSKWVFDENPKFEVQMALKCPVLPPYRPENQAQALPTRLAQVGLVLASGFSTKIRNLTGFIEGWTEI
jgi:hypothetical protein